MPSVSLCKTCKNVFLKGNASYLSPMDYDMRSMTLDQKKMYHVPELSRSLLNKVKTISKTFKMSNLNSVYMDIDLGKLYANRYVYYWAASKQTKQKIQKHDASYKKPNNGLTKLDLNGKAIIKLRCPQVYKEDGIVYLPHVHIAIVNKSNTKFLKKGFTFNVLCKLSYVDMKKRVKARDTIIINALPEKYYNNRHIPYSYNLPVLVAKKMNENSLDNFMNKIIYNPSNKKLLNLLEKNKVTLKTFPIITYCYKPTCDASEKLVNQLHRLGYVNVKEYPGGETEWFDIYKNN